MATTTIRISDKVKEELLELKDEYAREGTDKSDAVTISDTAWFDYMLKLGRKVFVSNRKKGK